MRNPPTAGRNALFKPTNFPQAAVPTGPGCEDKFGWGSARRVRALIFKEMAFSTRKDFLQQTEELGSKGQKVHKEWRVDVIAPIFRGGTTEYRLFELLVQSTAGRAINIIHPMAFYAV